MPLDLPIIRLQFPALKHSAIFFDNPGGIQVAQPVFDRMNICPDRAYLASIIGKADFFACSVAIQPSPSLRLSVAVTVDGDTSRDSASWVAMISSSSRSFT
jgi:hypothetical protein